MAHTVSFGRIPAFALYAQLGAWTRTAQQIQAPRLAAPRASRPALPRAAPGLSRHKRHQPRDTPQPADPGWPGLAGRPCPPSDYRPHSGPSGHHGACTAPDPIHGSAHVAAPFPHALLRPFASRRRGTACSLSISEPAPPDTCSAPRASDRGAVASAPRASAARDPADPGPAR